MKTRTLTLAGIAMVAIVALAVLGTWRVTSAIEEDINNDGYVTMADIFLVLVAFGDKIPTPTLSPTVTETPTQTATLTPTDTPTPQPTPIGYAYGQDTGVSGNLDWPANFPDYRVIHISNNIGNRVTFEKPLGVPGVTYEYERFTASTVEAAVEQMNLQGLQGWRTRFKADTTTYLIERRVGAPIIAHEYLELRSGSTESDALSALGAQGWRLVHIADYGIQTSHYILERELP